MLFEGYNILYLEGYLINNFPLVETACKIAVENKMLIALDLASYNVVEESRDAFRKVIKEYVDILFANEQEAMAFTGFEPEKALPLLSEMCEVVVLKVGAEGSWVKGGEEIVKVSAFPVECVDTTGAGDLYAAGFLYGYARELNLETCGIMGSLMAGKVIETVGARMDIARFAGIKKEIEVIMEEK
jgi:sugar/nucleoside kinase (ribokinase family)